MGRFDVIVGRGDYEHGKPAPDPFLAAAERLGDATGASELPGNLEAATSPKPYDVCQYLIREGLLTGVPDAR
jgi:hypothetical protein